MFNRNEDFNIILATDSYKLTHWKQYPSNTTNVYSYFESRGGEFESTVFFGLQYYLMRYLEGVVVTEEKIQEAQEVASSHLGNPEHFNIDGWRHILEKHGGKLPVRIKAVPEGTVVPVSNVLMTIEVTDPKCFWLTNYLETMLVEVWYPTTVATISYNAKKIINRALEQTGDPSLIDFKFHDFGYRGVSSQESAALGGAAHLVNFKGTDTMAALMLLREYYDEPCAGFSIPASEHSTISSWGREGELAAFRNMLEQHPTGVIACVSDSYNIWDACTKLWGTELKDMILSRDGTLVVRPDSGDPKTVDLKVLELLGESFGYTRNEKGYKVLDPHIRMIQGDGIDLESLKDILSHITSHGWSADNIAFGCGGGLLQKLNRDTQKFAFKASSVTIDGKNFDVYKDPITDQGKRSKRGRLALVKVGDTFVTKTELGDGEDDILQEVFLNGEVTSTQTLEEIRQRALTLKKDPT